jgi:hypothetical protein
MRGGLARGRGEGFNAAAEPGFRAAFGVPAKNGALLERKKRKFDGPLANTGLGSPPAVVFEDP